MSCGKFVAARVRVVSGRASLRVVPLTRLWSRVLCVLCALGIQRGPHGVLPQVPGDGPRLADAHRLGDHHCSSRVLLRRPAVLLLRPEQVRVVSPAGWRLLRCGLAPWCSGYGKRWWWWGGGRGQ